MMHNTYARYMHLQGLTREYELLVDGIKMQQYQARPIHPSAVEEILAHMRQGRPDTHLIVIL